MVATTIHLMRHGEVHNPEGVLYGRLPGYRLSERGVAMADTVAAHLAGTSSGAPGGERRLKGAAAAAPPPRRDVVAVIASPLQRAQETATPIAEAFGVDLATDPRIIEAAN